MDGLIIVVIAFLVVRMVGAVSAQRRQQRRQQNVEEQRRLHQAWQAQQQNSRHVAEHSAKKHVSGRPVKTDGAVAAVDVVSPAKSSLSEEHAAPVFPGDIAVSSAAGAISGAATMAAVCVAQADRTQPLFSHGLQSQEWLQGIIVSEILAPPLAKRSRSRRY